MEIDQSDEAIPMAKSVNVGNSEKAQTFVWLLLAAVLHVASTVVVFFVGRLHLSPDHFNAIGIGTSFASDGVRYHSEATALVQTLSDDGVVAWVQAPPQFHVKVYSLLYAAFGPLVGFNILAVEPINALSYVTIVYLVFAIGAQVFNRRAGFLSAVIVALWPSFLLHSTQLLRDQLLIALWLILILIFAKWLTMVLKWQRGVATAILASVVSLAIWIIRIDLSILMRASVIVVTVLVISRQLRERKFHLGNSLGALCLLITLMAVPQMFPSSTPEARDLIAERRRISIVTEQAGATSSVDKNVSLQSDAGIVRYLPRAIQIGFFAPFPNTWFQQGSGIFSLKWLLVGLETLAMYVIELAACLTLWRHRRRLAVWMLCVIAGMGMLGLGLVVVNIGTLYRLRYPFLIMLIIVASEGLMRLASGKTWKRRGRNEVAYTG